MAIDRFLLQKKALTRRFNAKKRTKKPLLIRRPAIESSSSKVFCAPFEERSSFYISSERRRSSGSGSVFWTTIFPRFRSLAVEESRSLSLSLSLSRFSLARLCGAIERAERLNSIVDCGYKTLNLKYPPPKKNALPLCKRTHGPKTPSFFPRSET